MDYLHTNDVEFETPNDHVPMLKGPPNNFCFKNVLKKKLLNVFSDFFFIWEYNPSF